MQQVTDWLEKLGLGQYAQRFAENDIDFALLAKLTDANLKELGVTSLGHRMRLLEAISERATTAPLPKLAEPKAADTAERRQVTVMFCDLVGIPRIFASSNRVFAAVGRQRPGQRGDCQSRQPARPQTNV